MGPRLASSRFLDLGGRGAPLVSRCKNLRALPCCVRSSKLFLSVCLRARRLIFWRGRILSSDGVAICSSDRGSPRFLSRLVRDFALFLGGETMARGGRWSSSLREYSAANSSDQNSWHQDVVGVLRSVSPLATSLYSPTRAPCASSLVP